VHYGISFATRGDHPCSAPTMKARIHARHHYAQVSNTLGVMTACCRATAIHVPFAYPCETESRVSRSASRLSPCRAEEPYALAISFRRTQNMRPPPSHRPPAEVVAKTVAI